LAVVITVLFVVVAGQSLWVQWFHASALDASPLNPRNNVANNLYPRGEILAANGTVLAQSVPTGNTLNPYKRQYPTGSLFAGEVGWTSTKYGEWGLEAQYNSDLEAHSLPAQSLEQVLAPTEGEESVTLTLQPALQELAQAELGGRDGSVVAIVPSTGSLLTLYSNPTYNPTPFTSSSQAVQTAAWNADNKKDADGYPPLGLVATQQTIFPGSTFKVITTAGVARFKPSLFTSTDYPEMVYTKLPDSNKLLYNDGDTECGGTIAEMLPESCDPGYALLGIALGAQDLTAEANAFGYNEIPPIDLPGAVASFFPTESNLAANPAYLGYSAIGQEDVSATALQNALVAAAIANKGVIMTPHLMSTITGPDGAVVQRYKDTAWKAPLTAKEAAQIVPLMQDVVSEPIGTAYGIFLPQDDVAAKTGTAQVGNNLTNDTDDWMIAFAPANNPTIAIAVSVPFQRYNITGALAAGPIMKCMIEGALALQAGKPLTGTSTTCATPPGYTATTTTTSTTTTTTTTPAG
jgi:penicillin-binding protein A